MVFLYLISKGCENMEKSLEQLKQEYEKTSVLLEQEKRKVRKYCSQGMIPHAYLSLLGTVSEPFAIHSKKAILLTLISLPLRNAGKPGVCTSS